MYFIDDNHKSRFEEALQLSGAVGNGGQISSYFGASLYLLSGLAYVYPRAKKFITSSCIDFEPILNELGLSTGERVVVALAGNLYNGGFFNDYTPADMLDYTDGEVFRLVVSALMLRKSKMDISQLAA